MARAKSKNKGDEIMKSLDRELAPKIHPSANYNYPSKNNIERTKADECNRGSPSEVKRQLKTSNSTVNYHQFARNFKSHPKMKAVLVQRNCDSAFHPSNCHDYPTIPTTFKRRTSLPDPPPLTSTNSAPAILASKTEKIISNPNLQSPAQPIANEINVPTVQKKSSGDPLLLIVFACPTKVRPASGVWNLMEWFFLLRFFTTKSLEMMARMGLGKEVSQQRRRKRMRAVASM
mmetsp:Transcript_5823/g.11929  ORF Transcript_5823/g.11929 Transcript_5823/m.11929 type:complete len:232 (-) Transcript_5823:1410-2105(-)